MHETVERPANRAARNGAESRHHRPAAERFVKGANV
jgi:hypothetical protein